MEIALGISMTTTTVRMVLVEGDKADGLTVECDQFPLRAEAEAFAASASEQAGAAILATQQSASRQGHNLSMCGIALSEECDAEDLRESLAARGLGDAVVVSEPQAAVALGHTVARAVGYTKTALLFVQDRAATLSVVNHADRSVVEETTRSLQSADVPYVLKEMFAGFTADGPQGLFVVDSSGRLPDIKPCLEAATRLPIIFPEEPEWALARGAALAAAAAPRFEASTTGLAYAQDPDQEDFADSAEDATGPLAPADEITRRGMLDVLRRGSTGSLDMRDGAGSSVRRFIPAGSVAASVVVLGVVTVVMALAASTAPTSTEHLVERGQILPTEPSTIEASAPPNTVKAAPAPSFAPLQQLPAPPPPPPPAPTAIAVQQSPRTVVTQVPASEPQPAQPVAAARAPVTARPAAAAPVEPPPEAAPAPVDPPPAAAPAPPAAPPPELPAVAPPAPVVQVPQFLPQITLGPPANPAPAIAPQAPFLRWLPAFLRPQQQAPVVPQAPVTRAPVPQWTPPVQQYTPPVQQYTPPAQQWTPPVQQYTPPVQQWTPPVQQWTPPVQQWTPPVQQYTPPARQWTPPVQQYTPPSQSGPGSGGFRGGSRGGSGGGAPFWPFG